MRGNHLHLGRQDYVEPPPLSALERTVVASVTISRVTGKKTWHAVHRCERLLGFVSTRMHGQYFRTPHMRSWRLAQDDWHCADPPHARAILALLRS